MSDKFEFTATHGVHLADVGAHFQRDHDAEGVVYRFATSDALQAAALLKVEGYGIRTDESTVKAAAAAEKKAEKDVDERVREAAAKAAAEAAAADQK